MKKIIFILSVLMAGSSVVNADDIIYDAFQNSGLSRDCQNMVLDAVQRRCNRDSLKAEGANRMNPCQDFESDVASSGTYQGQIEVGGYAGDADGYWYAITIRDADACKFKLTAEQ